MLLFHLESRLSYQIPEISLFEACGATAGMGFIQSNHSVIMYNNTMISFNMMEVSRIEGIKRRAALLTTQPAPKFLPLLGLLQGRHTDSSPCALSLGGLREDQGDATETMCAVAGFSMPQAPASTRKTSSSTQRLRAAA